MKRKREENDPTLPRKKRKYNQHMRLGTKQTLDPTATPRTIDYTIEGDYTSFTINTEKYTKKFKLRTELLGEKFTKVGFNTMLV